MKAVIRWPPPERSRSCQNWSAPRWSHWEHAHTLPPDHSRTGSGQPLPWAGVLPAHSTGGKPLKRSHFFRLVFLCLGQVLEWPQTPREMCQIGWASDEQSGATPGLVQMAHLTRTEVNSQLIILFLKPFNHSR